MKFKFQHPSFAWTLPRPREGYRKYIHVVLVFVEFANKRYISCNRYLSTPDSHLSHSLWQEVLEQPWKFWGQLQGEDELGTHLIWVGGKFMCFAVISLYSCSQLSWCSNDFQGYSYHPLCYNSLHCDPNFQGQKVVSQFEHVLCT